VAGFLRRKPNRFVALLIEQARFSLLGWESLLAYVRETKAEFAQIISTIEKDADEVRRILIEELHRTFVTPYKRDDIFTLSRHIDDVLDYAYTTMEEMVLFEVTPNVYMERMVSLLTESARELYEGIQHLESHPNVTIDHAARAKALENRLETVYREALADLFHVPIDVDHIVEMLKLREIYRHLSNAADRGDRAANVMGDIIVKTI
jgi:predicted phosphate transport protein (TIGR00153 family)